MYAYRNGSLINIYNTFLMHWERANPIVDNDDDEDWDPDFLDAEQLLGCVVPRVRRPVV